MDRDTPTSGLSWHLVTGEFPPDVGGVSDYTSHLARALANAGEDVHVWTSSKTVLRIEQRLTVHGLPGFGPSGLQLLSRGLSATPGRRRLLVQYVPQAYGFRGINLPFALWLASLNLAELWLHFHEVSFPFALCQRPQRNLLAAGQWWMAQLAAGRAERLLVSVPGWTRQLGRYADRAETLPIPSNVPVDVRPEDVARIRARLGAAPLVGHFGTYGSSIASLLRPILLGILREMGEARFLLLGHRGADFAEQLVSNLPELSGRLIAPRNLDATSISSHIAACDVLLQPFPDGISGRRTSAMAGLALGKPIVTTVGHLTEDTWVRSGAVVLAPVGDAGEATRAVVRLLLDREERDVVGALARVWYQSNFSIEHTLEILGIPLGSHKVQTCQNGP